jgi:hypothetical protein
VTGLVRWPDIQAVGMGVFDRIGVNFSFYDPRGLGLFAAASAAAVLLTGALVRPAERHRFAGVAALVGVTLAAWLGVHTYMHLAAQYFFVVMFPVYLAAGFAVGRSRLPGVALVLSAVILTAGLVDVGHNLIGVNEYQDSGLGPLLSGWREKWGVSEGFGHLNSNYNVMWAVEGAVRLPSMEEEERFKDWQAAEWSRRRILYVHQAQDRQPLWSHPGYRTLDKVALPYGFEAMVLEKSR